MAKEISHAFAVYSCIFCCIFVASNSDIALIAIFTNAMFLNRIQTPNPPIERIQKLPFQPWHTSVCRVRRGMRRPIGHVEFWQATPSPSPLSQPARPPVCINLPVKQYLYRNVPLCITTSFLSILLIIIRFTKGDLIQFFSG